MQEGLSLNEEKRKHCFETKPKEYNFTCCLFVGDFGAQKQKVEGVPIWSLYFIPLSLWIVNGDYVLSERCGWHLGRWKKNELMAKESKKERTKGPSEISTQSRYAVSPKSLSRFGWCRAGWGFVWLGVTRRHRYLHKRGLTWRTIDFALYRKAVSLAQSKRENEETWTSGRQVAKGVSREATRL